MTEDKYFEKLNEAIEIEIGNNIPYCCGEMMYSDTGYDETEFRCNMGCDYVEVWEFDAKLLPETKGGEIVKNEYYFEIENLKRKESDG